MPNIRGLLETVTKLANMASVVLPQAKLVGSAAQIGGKIIDIIDDLSANAEPDQQAEMQAARKKLSDAVKAKAASTSARLRG